MEEFKMPMLEHAEEFRKRLIYVLVSFVILLFSGFIFVDRIYDWIVHSVEQTLTVLGPSDIMWIYFVLAGSFALVFTTPVAVYQCWRFVSPGLQTSEKKALYIFLPVLIIFFLMGLCFGYYILFPSVLTFLTNLAGDHLHTMYTAEKYFKFLLNLTLPIGFLFEMPILIMLLTRLGIINPMILAKARKIAYFILMILSTLVTPPDFISTIIVFLPLVSLYELGISVSKYMYRKNERVLFEEAS
ncbi:twin-arginine translocase subunit TatC [Robertmurraya sp. P23]|uniref:twin-arginine translocase subunit TatC n=1 Tax=Robertmurraya sp. P23 TaxID=3436931 RepID=UPI003D997A82